MATTPHRSNNEGCKIVTAECVLGWILDKMLGHFQAIDLAASGMLDLSHEPTLNQLQLEQSCALIKMDAQAARMVLEKIR